MTQHSPLTHSAQDLFGRFLRLGGAVGIDGVLSAAFLFYLAWFDKDLYGCLMYGLAVAVITHKIVECGLYYPMVTALSQIPRTEAGRLLGPIGVLRIALSVLALVILGIFVLIRNLPFSMALATLTLTAGFALEVLAATAFDELRLRGHQNREARLRVIAALCSYGYGFLGVALGSSAPVIALFKTVGGVVLLIGGWRALKLERLAGFSLKEIWQTIRPLLAAAITLGGVDVLTGLCNRTNVVFLQAAAGTAGVALYSATWTIVDAMTQLATDQFLAWVLFPSLTLLWRAHRAQALALARQQAVALALVACGVMFVLHQEAAWILGLIYPTSFAPAAALQRLLVFTIGLSFIANIFTSLMIAAGSVRALLVITAISTLANFGLNIWWVHGPATMNACWVIVLTRLILAIQLALYCQRRFRLF
ncbi:MAG: hypothetical protein MUF51_03305, partial [Vicinamibacteria bacterium]|nr:hypothetical protein [Vicinamibacteria bacterium]